MNRFLVGVNASAPPTDALGCSSGLPHPHTRCALQQRAGGRESLAYDPVVGPARERKAGPARGPSFLGRSRQSRSLLSTAFGIRFASLGIRLSAPHRRSLMSIDLIIWCQDVVMREAWLDVPRFPKTCQGVQAVPPSAPRSAAISVSFECVICRKLFMLGGPIWCAPLIAESMTDARAPPIAGDAIRAFSLLHITRFY